MQTRCGRQHRTAKGAPGMCGGNVLKEGPLRSGSGTLGNLHKRPPGLSFPICRTAVTTRVSGWCDGNRHLQLCKL